MNTSTEARMSHMVVSWPGGLGSGSSPPHWAPAGRCSAGSNGDVTCGVVEHRPRGGTLGSVDTTEEAAIREQTTKRLEQAMGSVGTSVLAQMEERLPWFRRMPPDHRSWIGLVAQAGIAAFVEWFKNAETSRPAIAGEVFGTAPRDLMRAVRLQQTIDLVRVIVDVVEAPAPRGSLARAPSGRAARPMTWCRPPGV